MEYLLALDHSLAVLCVDTTALDATCRDLVKGLGDAGFLHHAVSLGDAEADKLDVRSLCLLRETLGRHHALADFAFAMQGLGSGPISLFGSAQQKSQYLPRSPLATLLRRLRCRNRRPAAMSGQ